MINLPPELVNIIISNIKNIYLYTCIQFVCKEWQYLSERYIVKSYAMNKVGLKHLCFENKTNYVHLYLKKYPITKDCVKWLFHNHKMYVYMCKTGQLKALKLIVKKYDLKNTCKISDYNYDLLKKTCGQNQIEVVKWFTSVYEFKNEDFIKALKFCRYHKKPDIAKMLVRDFDIYIYENGPVNGSIEDENQYYLCYWLKNYFVFKKVVIDKSLVVSLLSLPGYSLPSSLL